MSRPVAAPITHGWVSAGGTGAPNYDEFAGDAEITAVIAANPDSALAVEMPHCAPGARGTFAESLDAATATLERLLRTRFTRHEGLVAPYRVDGPEGTAYGVFCAVDTAQISASAAEPGLVIRNEDVFAAKVRERTALTRRVGTLLSPVLLLQTARGDALQAALEDLTRRLGAPDVTDLDAAGRTHAVWALGPGPDADRLLALAGGGELVVADGNHRSLSAQEAGLDRFLAVVTTPASVRIAPYNRLVTDLGGVDLPAGLEAAGAGVEPLGGPPEVPAAGVVLYTGGTAYRVALPAATGTVVDRLDHTVVERVLFGDVLGMAPDDARITYVGGDYGAGWLAGEVDAGRAAAAVLVAPVGVEDFLAVNLARLKMPRKSTWFIPKARGGLVLAET
ncbi:MAG TPA: DUF1015 family protein [Mycobacteriales bacterium]|jgi:uncharacterized protein (DUF1015 family)|nr:DUF1015 family protein [Mycobacteriales bacterium]